MTASHIIVWRHGRTRYNQLGLLQGQLNIDLDEVGRTQAVTAAEWLAKREPEAVVASDLRRAVQTAGELARRTGLEITTDPGLREQNFGDWEGLAHDDIARRWPEEQAVWESGDSQAAPPGGESRAQAGLRVAEAIRRHAEAVEGTLVVTGHGASLRCAVAALLGDVDEWYRLGSFGNAHWGTLELRRRGWALREYNVGTEPQL